MHVPVSELYIPTMGLPVLLEEICRLILGIYKSLKDAWMRKLGLRGHAIPRKGIYKRNCRCSVGNSEECCGIRSSVRCEVHIGWFAQETIPRYRFGQPMWPGGPVRQPYLLYPKRRHGSTIVPGHAFLAWRSSWRMVVYIYCMVQKRKAILPVTYKITPGRSLSSSQPGGPPCWTSPLVLGLIDRIGPPGYIGWQNRFFGINFYIQV